MAEAMSETSTSSWYDDAPITDEQLDAIRRSLDHPNSRVGSPFAPFVVRKLLAEVERLRAHLVAEHLATEAAETENDRLRARLDEIGETREEWGYRFPAPGDPDEAGFDSGAAVRVSAKPGDRIMMRVVGEWRDIEREVPDA